jgi:hypothetical protein
MNLAIGHFVVIRIKSQVDIIWEFPPMQRKQAFLSEFQTFLF